MTTRAMSFFRSLSRQLAPLTLAGAVIAYLYPPAFLIFADTFLWFFAATMLALGVVLEPSDLKRTLLVTEGSRRRAADALRALAIHRYDEALAVRVASAVAARTEDDLSELYEEEFSKKSE